MTAPLVLPHLAAITPPGHEIQLVDLLKERPDLSDRSDLVGISLMTPTAEEGYRLADACREKGLKVVLGGVHPSALPLEAKAHADAVVVGEAEETWATLLKDLEAGSLKEFYVAGPGWPVAEFPPDRTFWVKERPNLNGLPLPKRELLPRHYVFDSIMTSRGCAFQCRFCSIPRLHGGTPRHRPVEEVAEEVRRVRHLWLMLDDDIFGDLPYRLELYQRLAESNRWMRWYGTGSLAVAFDRSGKEVLELAARSGLNAVFLGLESAEVGTLSSLLINQKLRQGQEVDFGKTIEGIRRIRGFNIMVAAFFILGSDADSRETFEKTLSFCDEACVAPVPLLLIPLPGTPLWADYENRLLPGLTWDKWDGLHALYSHPSLGVREREELLHRLQRTSYTFKRVIRRLKGLSLGVAFTSFLIQLGLWRSLESDWKRVQQS